MSSYAHKIFILASMLLILTSVVRADMPSDADMQRVVDEAHAAFKDIKDGANANYIPILDTVPSELFGVVIVTRDGEVFSAGDVDYRFSIQSVSKPFTAALIMAQQGPEAVREKNRWSNRRACRSIPRSRSRCMSLAPEIRSSMPAPLPLSALWKPGTRQSAGTWCMTI